MKGLTQNDLALKSGLSITYISMLENGKKSPTIRTLAKISKSLDIPNSILTFLCLQEEDVDDDLRVYFNKINSTFMEIIKEHYDL